MSVVRTRASGLISGVKRRAAQTVLTQALNLLSHAPDSSYRLLAQALYKIAKNERQHMVADWVAHWVEDGPGRLYLHRVLRELHPNVRRYYAAQMLTNVFFRDPNIRAKCIEENGFAPPSTMLISPSMRCNYRCVGCWAGEYTQESDLPPEVLDRVLQEAKAIGLRHFGITGGEPFIYRPLWDMFDKHHDCTFQVYTNGSLITDEAAHRLAELGNVSPQVSVNGEEAENDSWRGKGAYQRALRAMDRLRQAGAFFAYSCVVTHQNIDSVTSAEFVDTMIEHGTMWCWYFLYMPVGRDPDLSAMPTAQDREKLRRAIIHYRNTRPMLFADFWNDAPLIGGCIAGGRIYFHINHKGDVEPCVFNHFSDRNIKECSLVEALKSPLFTMLRTQQPYGRNLLRPCPIIDHPYHLRQAVALSGARPTHAGAESVITDLAPGLDGYARSVAEVYDPVWGGGEYDWVEKWLPTFRFPREVEGEARAFQQSGGNGRSG
ncbi:MAG: radical SAM protein [Chloroflexi bacterium]|nr:radical SAM protein [Chloroflexota bacterium]